MRLENFVLTRVEVLDDNEVFTSEKRYFGIVDVITGIFRKHRHLRQITCTSPDRRWYFVDDGTFLPVDQINALVRQYRAKWDTVVFNTNSHA